ncbi:AfsR/SARP family transcriptional regulator [Streptomyces hesseae]|uniref:BTAD domain-containing putative transcriptional regulator n=1 Tax=Streptomyces hesseae TaxID=3075519 RepID=A0ABU2SHK1_9ACTN|nr:BTAD domain-containing putative transcriptional regulator [Streptomyces sp. DSM 40473]MDT0448263.1 BTAD domain-containing putative transcriptional regulator [Streptomyces sp. DSM 40473]
MGIRDGESVVPCGPPQQQATLAMLALRRGHAVPLHELVSGVWGDTAPDSAVMIVRTYVWRLRKLLTSADCDPQVLARVGDGYRLAEEPLSVDAFEAEHLAADAARARGAEKYDECAMLLKEAVSLWRGEPLAGVPGPFADRQRSRLSELRLTLMEERFDLDLLLGRHAQSVPELTAFIQEQPLRERPYGFLMRALYAAGRQADALAVFGKAREVLAHELGLDPGPELRALHERILACAPDLVPTAAPVTAVAPAAHPQEAGAAAGQAGATDFARPAQLPADISDFSGRNEAVAELCRALTDPDRTALAVASVSGMGGIGKSTLALKVAHQVKGDFPDGQLYADLRGSGTDAADPGTILVSFLTALGVSRRKVPGSLEDRSRMFRTLLDDRRVLLLLDNARDAAQVRPLLPGAAHCAVVVTSRARLVDVPCGAHVRLAEFSTGEALSLVRRIVGESRIAPEEEAALALVVACACLPLAVRIVATRLSSRPGWTVAHLVARLADERRRLAELRADDLAVAAAFELGYHQLTDRQAMAFRSLASVAWPHIGLGAASAALGLDETEAEDLLEPLVDAALLESPAPGRYRYHDLVRDFARQLPPPTGTSPSDEGSAVERRLLDHLLEMAGEAFRRMVPGDPVHSTIAAGAVRPDGPRFTDLAEAREWVITEFDCALHTVQLLVRRWEAAEPELLTEAADVLVALSSFGQDVPYAQMATAAEALAETAALAGNHRAAGRAHFICGNAAIQETRLTRARTHAQRAAEFCRRAGDRAILQQAYNDLGVIAQFEQRYDDAAGFFDEALVLAREWGQRSGELITTLNAALARIRGRRAEEALPACEEALSALRGMADQHGVAHALCVRGQALHELGRYQEALDGYRECLDVCATAGIPGQQAQAWYRCAETLRVMGDVEQALESADRAVAYYRTVPGRDRDRGYALWTQARVSLGAGHHGRALDQANEALEVFTRTALPEAAQVRALIDGIRPATV